MALDDARLHELRRLAFGRTHSAEDEARAEAARLELEAALAPDPELPQEPEAEPEPVVEALQSEVEPPVEQRRTSWVLPAIAALVVGVLLGAGGLFAASRGIAAATPVTPAPTMTFTPGSSALPPKVVPLSADQPVTGSPGDFSAAMLWFDRDQQKEDKLEAGLVRGSDIVLTSSRLVYSMGPHRVWVAQSNTGQLCLVGWTTNTGTTMCATPDEFAATGLPLHIAGSLSVVWNGNRIVTSIGPGA